MRGKATQAGNTPFGSEQVINQKIAETDLRAYLVGFDLDDEGNKEYRWVDLVNILLNVVHEYAFGFHLGETTDNTETATRIFEAARSIYQIKEFQQVHQLISEGKIVPDDIEDKYLKRGEFGELILHLLLRDFHNTIPLISKIYFKDAYGATVHGFDAVHIQPDTRSLWLGESKLYIDPRTGIKALIEDIKLHVTHNYMESEFALISKKLRLFNNIPEKEYWLQILHRSSKLSDQIDNIYLPILCTYSSGLFSTHDDETSHAFIAEFEKEIRGLKAFFDEKNDHPLKASLHIILLLFPVKCKNELVKRMHNKLYMLQQVGAA